MNSVSRISSPLLTIPKRTRQAERSNQTIMENLKKGLVKAKGRWTKELQSVLRLTLEQPDESILRKLLFPCVWS